ncbi:MAG: DUF4974 domain-containing protein [Rikenellaceae bacterium]|nr:DUF4974 domain-containing protein [Rikenellaceae bacterium]
MFELSDKSKVYVGSLTTFSCDERFGRRDRRVHLDGEAYFEVTGDPEKPFIVQAGGQDIEVLGTKFNVAAYSQDSVVVTTLLEGSVKLRFKDIGRSFTLAPNQQYIYNHTSGTGTLKRVNASSVVSWIDGYYFFRDERLGSIIHQLENMYAIKADMSASKYMDISFTGTFYRGQSVSEILDILSTAAPIKYTLKDDTVTILDRK